MSSGRVVPERAVRRLADGRAHRRDDDRVFHGCIEKSPSRSSSASPTSCVLSVEQVIGAVDHDELLRLLQPAVERPHAFERADLVGFALHEELGLGARERVRERVVLSRHRRDDRRRDADERGHAVVGGAGLERDPRRRTRSRRPRAARRDTAPPCSRAPRGSPPARPRRCRTRPRCAPTPRKLNRSTAQPMRASPFAPWYTALVCIVPPCCGCGCAKTTAARDAARGVRLCRAALRARPAGPARSVMVGMDELSDDVRETRAGCVSEADVARAFEHAGLGAANERAERARARDRHDAIERRLRR